MNVGVVGSRNWTDRDLIYRVLLDINQQWLGNYDPCPEYPLGRRGEDDMHIISGGARGVDTIAVEWGIVHWVKFTEYKPEWTHNGHYNPRAGFERNETIIRNSDVVLAFQKDASRGTQNSIDWCRKLGVPVIIWKE
jgi:hypothetical protein